MLADTDTDFSESEALSSLQISGKHDESGECSFWFSFPFVLIQMIQIL